MQKAVSNVSSQVSSWVTTFCALQGNEFFCAVDKNFIRDDFNLSGLSEQVPNFRQAKRVILDLVPGALTGDNAGIADSAKMLYGLIHARYIMTERGMSKMLLKYDQGVFGSCLRVYCEGQFMVPIGLSDVPCESTVKLYCRKCKDVYQPLLSRHRNVDGAFFGKGFPHMLFLSHPNFAPENPKEKYVPKLFGFKIHESAILLQQKAAEDYRTHLGQNK